MCTVTWIRERAGYALWFNRDERPSRGPERGPREEHIAGTAFLAPADTDHGGTWLAVNEYGLCLGLLNAYDRGAPENGNGNGRRSRGLLVRELAGSPSGEDVLARLARADLTLYAPFVLLCVEPGRDGDVARWNGMALATETADPSHPLVSSGLEAEGVRRFRDELFASLCASQGASQGASHGAPTPAVLENFMQSHDGGPSIHSPCMHAESASTRSQCRVRVTAELVELVHLPGPPCTATPSAPLRLRRAVHI